ncbi:type I-C CRISPR-associated protein Cas7/Csd2 [Maridesulfovibrio sp.]|uniref:type I-C CRISPR-associated protein Cas7/Csd2 n=1 Tax=Maridesulfovibrio sp. TaxID=2795000 RepID=UPI0039EEDB14
MGAITNRYEFVYLFDVENGNPNGDPDAGNLPRVDPETGHGLVTDVCLKRKIRNFVEIAKGEEEGFNIYVAEKAVLNRNNEQAYKALEIKQEKKKLPKDQEKARKLTRWMCDNFFDVRTFGAVMTTEVNCGQVRGPVQLTFAKSIEPIMPSEISITRMAVTNEKDLEKERTMGRKFIVPYALYRAEGYISAHLADGDKGTGFSESDLELLWQSLANMFDHDHSAARGKMNARGLVVFKHESKLGNSPAHKLFEAVSVEKNNNTDGPARAFSDYTVKVDESAVPEGVDLDVKF